MNPLRCAYPSRLLSYGGYMKLTLSRPNQHHAPSPCGAGNQEAESGGVHIFPSISQATALRWRPFLPGCGPAVGGASVRPSPALAVAAPEPNEGAAHLFAGMGRVRERSDSGLGVIRLLAGRLHLLGLGDLLSVRSQQLCQVVAAACLTAKPRCMHP